MKWSYLVTVSVGIAIGFIGRSAFVTDPAAEPTDLGGSVRPGETRTLGSALPIHSPAAATVATSDLFDENYALKKPRPSDAQLLTYVEEHGYSRDALVAAALLSKDLTFLIDAARRYPDDPQVQLMVIQKSLLYAEKLPGEKAEWVERFKDSQPHNLLASMLLGSDLLVRGETEKGLEELRIGTGQMAYRDYTAEASLLMEQALVELGHTPLEAKVASGFGDPIASTTQVQQGVVELYKLIEATENLEEKAKLATLGAAIGNQLTQGEGGQSYINQMIGLRMEKGFLGTLDPDLASPSFDRTPGEMVVELKENIAELRWDEFFEHFPRLDEHQMTHYFDRKRVLGELNAYSWLVEQFE